MILAHPPSPDAPNAPPAKPSKGASTIGERFEEIVRQHGEHIAFRSGTETLSYRVLAQMADAIAAGLPSTAHHPSSVVIIRLPLGGELMAAVLGALAAGHIVTLADPMGPDRALQLLLADTDAAVLVGDGRTGPWPPTVLPQSCTPYRVTDLLSSSGPRPRALITPESVASLVYTSGSTGRPKGTIRLHRNVLGNVLGRAAIGGIGSEERACFLSPPHTGNGFSNLMRTVLNGGTLLGYDVREHGLDGVTAWLQSEAATLFNASASLFRELTRTWSMPPGFPSLRTLRLGSEPVLRQDVELFRRFFPATCRLINALSCTEVGTITSQVFEAESALPDRAAPIGRPLPGVAVRLLDDQGRLAAPGQPGELIVASPTLTPGYWRRPELNARRFRPLPGEEDPVYFHTGDVCQELADGTMVHVGRKDLRVKVRGIGVELEGVETVLAGHSGVRRIAVTAPPSEARGAGLIAFFVPATSPAPSAESLRQQARSELPEPAVPAVFIPVDELPLTSQGKIDRPRLSKLARQFPAPKRLSTPPRHPNEVALEQIWREVLECGPIGIEESFFDCGGHSLSATRVLARVRQRWHQHVSLAAFLKQPTLEWLAAQVRELPPPTSPDLEWPKVPREGPQTLAYPQQRLWFLDQLESNRATYNLPWALRLRGSLDVAVLHRTLTEITRRHEILRTVYRAVNGVPHQFIRPPVGLDSQLVDLSAQAATEREAALSHTLAEQAWRPFDLASEGVWRTALVRLAHDDHVLLLTLHHIASDRWSKAVLSRELTEIYGAFRAGRPSPLPEPVCQYLDFAAWQKRQLEGPREEALQAYWQEALAGMTECVLPVDRAPTRDEPAGLVKTELPSVLLRDVEHLAQREGVSLYVVMLAAFHCLLHRLTGQSDLATGTAIANRNHPHFESAVGFFVNTLVLRGQLDGNPTFREFLRRLWQTAVAAYEHQDLPFERVVEIVQPTRHPDRQPLVPVLFTLQNVPRWPLRLEGLAIERLELPVPRARFDLNVTLLPETGASGIRMHWEYAAGRLEQATVERWASAFAALLKTAVTEPEALLGDLPAFAPGERERQLVTWNATEKAYPRDASLAELFTRTVERCPDATALVAGDELLSYGELAQRSRRLARHLKDRGVQAGDFVGVHLDRSVEFVVTVLAVLHVGAAYVPLPPEFPAARLHAMRSDAGIRCVVTDRSLPAGWDHENGVVVDWRQDAAAIEAAPADPLHPEVSSLSPAYVMFTSGSTGLPKGVVVPHRAVVRLVCGADYLPWGSGLRFLVLAPVGFDASTFEIWGALLHGDTAILHAPGPLDLTRLARELTAHSVTCAFLTTGLFHAIVDSQPEMLSSLRHLLVGGEVLSVSHLQRALERAPHLEFVHCYGPTESTTFATTHRIRRDSRRKVEDPMPIGRPIANTRAYVLDPQGGLLPTGAAGELYLGGDGLALGYLNDAALTAAKFVPDPFGHSAGGRLYRTGDRCRWRHDGTLEFLGRFDAQLKVRGYRIEPGEVESVLVTHPGIRQAAVFGQPAVGGTVLAAALVPSTMGLPELTALRAWLAERLPEAWVPTILTSVPVLPLNANGKVDRARLRETGTVEAIASAEPRRGPKSATETELLEIARRLLGQPDFGVEDNFFEAGGHSLLAVRLIAESNRRLGTRLQVLDLFRFPTVARLATQGVSARTQPMPDTQRVLKGAQRGTPLLHIPGRFGVEFFSPRLAAHIGARRPYFDGLQFPGMDSQSAMPTSVEAIAADLIKQIERVCPTGPLCLSGHSWGGVVAVEVARQLRAAGRTIEIVVLFDTLLPGSSKPRPWPTAAVVFFSRLRAMPASERVRFMTKLVRDKSTYTWSRWMNRLKGASDAARQALEHNAAEASQRSLLWLATEPAFAAYRPQPYDGDVALLRATRQLPNEGLRRQRQPLNGWPRVVRGRLRDFPIPTHHSGVSKEPIHPAVFEALTEVLGPVP